MLYTDYCCLKDVFEDIPKTYTLTSYRQEIEIKYNIYKLNRLLTIFAQDMKLPQHHELF